MVRARRATAKAAEAAAAATTTTKKTPAQQAEEAVRASTDGGWNPKPPAAKDYRQAGLTPPRERKRTAKGASLDEENDQKVRAKRARLAHHITAPEAASTEESSLRSVVLPATVEAGEVARPLAAPAVSGPSVGPTRGAKRRALEGPTDWAGANGLSGGEGPPAKKARVMKS